MAHRGTTKRAARQAVERARRNLDRARDAVYAAAHPRRDIPLSQCLAMADEPTRTRYQLAMCNLEEAEQVAVSSGRAWRSTSESLYWYGD